MLEHPLDLLLLCGVVAVGEVGARLNRGRKAGELEGDVYLLWIGDITKEVTTGSARLVQDKVPGRM